MPIKNLRRFIKSIVNLISFQTLRPSFHCRIRRLRFIVGTISPSPLLAAPPPPPRHGTADPI